MVRSGINQTHLTKFFRHLFESSVEGLHDCETIFVPVCQLPNGKEQLAAFIEYYLTERGPRRAFRFDHPIIVLSDLSQLVVFG